MEVELRSIGGDAQKGVSTNISSKGDAQKGVSTNISSKGDAQKGVSTNISSGGDAQKGVSTNISSEGDAPPARLYCGWRGYLLALVDFGDAAVLLDGTDGLGERLSYAQYVRFLTTCGIEWNGVGEDYFFQYRVVDTLACRA